MKKSTDKNYLTKALLISVFLFTQTASVFPWEYVLNNNKAIKYYKDKKYDLAEPLFKQSLDEVPENLDLKYNMASNMYKQKRYIESQAMFLDILKDKNASGELKQKVHYDLGNVLYRLGEQNNPDLFWHNALKEYERAISIVPEDKEAKENYEFVKNKLKQLNPPPQNNQNKNQNSEGSKNSQDQQKQQMQAYSNTNPNQPDNQQNQNFNVTEAEAENILQGMKSEEENMQNYVNRRQFSSENNSKGNPNLKKDW